MITPISAPAPGAVLLDANNTVITIQSSNGTGYYFRATIYINGALFDEQSWSRFDAFTASKDIKKIYNAYINPQFNDNFDVPLEEQTDFKKRVSITVKEYNLETGTLEQTVELPDFYIMYNIKPVEFTHTQAIRLLGLDAAAMVIPANGKIAVPFYVNAEAQSLIITLSTASGNTITTQVVPAFTGKRAYLFKHNMAAAPVAYGTTHLTLTIALGANVQKVNYRINHLPDYPFKQIAFRNNFGYYLYAYPDGELEVTDSLNVETYEQEDGSEAVSEISEEATYTINTGSYRQDEKAIMNMIANSPDAWLYNGGAWLKLLPQTKKLNSFTDRKHVYNNDLLFKVYKDAAVANTGMVTTPLYPNIYITHIIEEKRRLEIYYTLNNGFAGAVQVDFRANSSASWLPLGISYSDNPIVVSFSASLGPTAQIRLSDYATRTIISNVKNVIFT